MKRFQTLLLVGVLLASLPMAGCKKFVEGYEISPNNPSEVSLPLLLSGAEVGVFFTHEGHLCRAVGVMMQQLSGFDGPYPTIENYQMTESDFENDWSTIYSRVMVNLHELYTKADAEGCPHYAGIGRTLQAMMLGLTTDCWGNVPYSQAFRGADNLNPAYDTQEQVYGRLQQMLDQAIQNLSANASDNVLLPGADDYLYQGDVTRWRTLAYLLKARFHNHLSKRNPGGSATQALAALDAAGISTLSAADANALTVHGAALNESNQWFQFENERGGYIVMGRFLVDTMTALADPRLGVYASPDGDGGYSGSFVNAQNPGASTIGAIFLNPARGFPLMTLAEARFIEAEAALRAGQKTRAVAAYNAAIAESMALYGVSPTDASNYIMSVAVSDTDPDASLLSAIMFQKYLAGFLTTEIWTDYRRTGIPALTAPTGSYTNGVLPRRLPTPQAERLNNTSAEVVTDVTRRIWWDE